MNVERRIEIEKQIIEATLKAIVAAGYWFRWCDGECWVGRVTQDVEATLKETHATDEESLTVYLSKPNPDDPWKAYGDVVFIYGNDGYDVLADYSVCLEDIIKPANELANQIEQEEG